MRRRRARPPPPTPASVPTGGGAPAPSMAVLAAAPPFFGAHAGPAAAAAAAAPLFGAPAGPAAVPSAATPLLRAPAEALLPPPLLPRRLLAPPPGPLGFPPAAPAPAGGAVGALVGADPATPAPLFRAGGRATRGTASALVLSACSGSCAPPRSRGLPGPTAPAHPWQLSVRARTVRLPSPLAKVGLPARARAPRLAHGSRSFAPGPVDQQIALRSFETRPVCTVRLFICAPAAWVAGSASSATAAGTRTCRLNLPVVSYVAGYLRIAVRRFATRGPRARLTCGTFLAHCRPYMPRDFGGLHGARGGAGAPRQARSLVC